MSSVNFVSCGVLFYLLFIFNIFVTSESMYIVMMIEKKKKIEPNAEATTFVIQFLYKSLHYTTQFGRQYKTIFIKDFNKNLFL